MRGMFALKNDNKRNQKKGTGQNVKNLCATITNLSVAKSTWTNRCTHCIRLAACTSISSILYFAIQAPFF